PVTGLPHPFSQSGQLLRAALTVEGVPVGEESQPVMQQLSGSTQIGFVVPGPQTQGLLDVLQGRFDGVRGELSFSGGGQRATRGAGVGRGVFPKVLSQLQGGDPVTRDSGGEVGSTSGEDLLEPGGGGAMQLQSDVAGEPVVGDGPQ